MVRMASWCLALVACQHGSDPVAPRTASSPASVRAPAASAQRPAAPPPAPNGPLAELVAAGEPVALLRVSLAPEAFRALGPSRSVGDARIEAGVLTSSYASSDGTFAAADHGFCEVHFTGSREYFDRELAPRVRAGTHLEPGERLAFGTLNIYDPTQIEAVVVTGAPLATAANVLSIAVNRGTATATDASGQAHELYKFYWASLGFDPSVEAALKKLNGPLDSVALLLDGRVVAVERAATMLRSPHVMASLAPSLGASHSKDDAEAWVTRVVAAAEKERCAAPGAPLRKGQKLRRTVAARDLHQLSPTLCRGDVFCAEPPLCTGVYRPRDLLKLPNRDGD